MLYRRGKVWWFAFWFNGERVQKSTKVRNKAAASEIERAFRTSLAKEEVGIRPKRKLRFEGLAAGLVTDFENNNRRDLQSLKSRLVHLQKFFGGRSAESITSSDIKAYVKSRLGEKAANGTINRELAALKRAFNIALADELLDTRPHIALLTEAEPRQGFFDPDKFAVVIRNLPEHLQAVARFACLTGWRRSEITGLTWELVDLKEREIRLPPSMSKNKQPRFLPLEGELWDIIAGQRQTVGCPRVFHNHGKPIWTFYKAWANACRAAGCPDALFHDLRRTGARNLRRAGLSEEQAMRVTGHVTSSVFRRYNIQTEDDIRQAVRATGAFAAAREPQTAKSAPQ